MTDVWLAIIAVAVAVMAAIQVGAIVLGLRLARRVDQLTTQIEHDVKPLLQNLTAMTAEAQRAMQLATAQVERADRLFGDLAVSAERTMALASQFVGGPAQNGLALFSAARVAYVGVPRPARGVAAPAARPANGRPPTTRSRSSSADLDVATPSPAPGGSGMRHVTATRGSGGSRRHGADGYDGVGPGRASRRPAPRSWRQLLAGKKLDAIAVQAIPARPTRSSPRWTSPDS